MPAETSIVCMDWYNGIFGQVYVQCPNIALCYENGYIQLMCNESDSKPILVETKLATTYCCWNHNGSLIAVTGKQYSEGKSNNVIQFYSAFGEHLRTLKLPGQGVSSCSWEEGSLRIAIGIESSVYFANIRPDYKWCYFKNTVVFTSCRLQKGGVCISFWDIATHQRFYLKRASRKRQRENLEHSSESNRYSGNSQPNVRPLQSTALLLVPNFGSLQSTILSRKNIKCHTKFVPVLIAMAACEDHCVLVTHLDTDNPMGKYGLLLCNTLGTPVDGKYTDIEVKWVAMNSTHVAAASKNNYFLWQYKTPKSSVSLKDVICQIYHVDYDPSGAMHVMKDLKVSIDDIPINGKADSTDPICCIALSEKYLIIGKESGILKYYKVPHVIIVNTYHLSVRPNKILLNCNSTRLSVIDMVGVLTVLDITESALQAKETENARLERRDVWAMCWASDNPQLLAIMEKTRMYIFKGIYPEEPISSAGYICSFQNLEIQAVLLDELMETPEKPLKEYLFKLEVKSLRDTRQLLEKVGIKEAALFIDDNPHPRLWHLLGEAALKDLNFKVAEDAFVRSADYVGIQFVKKLKTMTSDAIKRASVAAYFKNFDEAEKIFVEEDRLDLALNIRKTLGDWFRVIQLIKNGVAVSDQTLDNAYNRTADYFIHMNNWSAALEYYELAKNTNKMCEAYVHLQDYKALEHLIDQLEEQDPLLKKIATVFTLAGDYVPAIKSYLKVGDLGSAIDVSVINHQWDQAIAIAKTYRLHQISDLFVEYSDHLVKQGKITRAVEINVQAKYWFTAAKHAMEMADTENLKINKELITIKMMYVYAARLVELHKADPNSEEKVDAVLSVDLLENHWKGAEAYHFYLLAHRQLYSCHMREAVCTLYKLQEYFSYIPSEEVYALLALAAYFSGAYSLCSEIFVKLQSLPEISIDEKSTYKELATKIFIVKEPVTVKKKHFCTNCHSAINFWRTSCTECETKFPTCIATGCPIMPDNMNIQMCSTCHHIAADSHLVFKNVCPLCHSRFE